MKEYSELQVSEDEWACPTCYCTFLPFAECSTINSTIASLSSSTITELSTTSSNDAGLTLYYCNCRSLLPKMDDLRILVNSVNPDLLALTETWLASDIMEIEVRLEGYRMFRRDRDRHGGGVAIYVSDCISVASVSYCDNLEFMSVVLSFESGPMLVGVHYRPPSAVPSLDLLEAAIHDLNITTYKSCAIVGDFNIDLKKADDQMSLDLLGVTSSFGLSQKVLQPTRCNNVTSSLIDHVYVSALSSLHIGPPLGVSDHCSLTICLSHASINKPPSVKRRIWDYKKANFEGLNEELHASFSELQGIDCDVNELWSRFRTKFMTCVRRFIPSKQVRCKKYPPWICEEILHLTKKRDSAHKVARKKPSEVAWAKYRSCRNKVVAALRAGKKKYFDSLSGMLGTMKDFWTTFHSITKVHQRVPATMTNGVELASSDISKATLLNEQFKSIFAPLSPLPDPPPIAYGPENISTLDCVGDEVKMVLRSLRPNVASGPDEISSRMLKNCAESICEPLAEIFNCSLASGIVPRDWQ